MAAPMTEDEVRAFLDSRPGWIVLTTTSPNGYPHTVPIGYFRRGDEILMGCRAGTQKTRNVERDGRVSLMLESGSVMAELRGVVIQGDAEVVTEEDELLELSREGARQRGTPDDELPTEVGQGRAYIRVRPRRTISWDYSKEG